MFSILYCKCTLYSAVCVLCIVYCAVHSKLYSVQCTLYSAVCALCIVYFAVHSKRYGVLCTHGNKLFSQTLIFLSSYLCNLIFKTLTIWSQLEILKVFNIRLQRSIGRENKSMGRVISSFVYNVSCTYTRVDIVKHI